MTRDDIIRRIADIIKAENNIRAKDVSICRQWDELDLVSLRKTRKKLEERLHGRDYDE